MNSATRSEAFPTWCIKRAFAGLMGIFTDCFPFLAPEGNTEVPHPSE